jgi:hypothetical protein
MHPAEPERPAPWAGLVGIDSRVPVTNLRSTPASGEGMNQIFSLTSPFF